MSRISANWRQHVRRRANERCEYCHMPEALASSIYHVDHIIPERHDGPTSLDNLALCCPWCNYSKSCNLAGIDRATSEIVSLFHPRRMAWHEHFAFRGWKLLGLTATGRATEKVLEFNGEDQVEIRQALHAARLFRYIRPGQPWERAILTRLEELHEQGKLKLNAHRNRTQFSVMEWTDVVADPYRTRREIEQWLLSFV
jgi:HNH endonuclease